MILWVVLLVVVSRGLFGRLLRQCQIINSIPFYLGGETVKYLQQLSGARIQVEPNTGGPQSMRKVHIVGN
jgi:hypothetical protein